MRGQERIGAAAPVVCVLLLAAAVLLPAPQVLAQTVQKCIGANGHVTLTSGDCAAGERLAASFDARPLAEPEPRPVAERARPVSATRSQGLTRQQRQAARARTAPDRCKAARERRERTLERVGLKRDFDLLRRLDGEVRAACR